jgi:hypothetical protein
VLYIHSTHKPWLSFFPPRLLHPGPRRETRYRLAIFHRVWCAPCMNRAFHRDSDTLSITRPKLPLNIPPPTLYRTGEGEDLLPTADRILGAHGPLIQYRLASGRTLQMKVCSVQTGLLRILAVDKLSRVRAAHNAPRDPTNHSHLTQPAACTRSTALTRYIHLSSHHLLLC